MNIAIQAQAFLNGLMTDKTFTKWIKLASDYLPLAVTLLLILQLASNAAHLTWRMIPAAQEDRSSIGKTPRAPAPTGQRDDGIEDLEKVAGLHLFGLAGQKAVTKIEAKAPETRLNLTLHGVFVEKDPEQGTAIIGTSGNTQKYYKVGATIMSGVKLQGVFKDRVVLLRNGQSEVLRFPKVSSSGSGSVASLPTSAVTRGRSAAPVAAESLREYREIFQNEPLKVFEYVRFVPVRSREGLKGYRMLPQKNRELYNKLGIRPSDLVTSVNGVTLTNDQEAMKLMGMMKEATTIQVDIVRNGQPQSLTFDLN